MSTVAAQEIKRRGISAVDPLLRDGPVHLLKNNRATYVVMSEDDYREMMTDLEEARLAASEMDLQAGRVRRGDSRKLMKELLDE